MNVGGSNSPDMKLDKAKLKYEDDLGITRIKEDTLESALSSPEKSQRLGIDIKD